MPAIDKKLEKRVTDLEARVESPMNGLDRIIGVVEKMLSVSKNLLKRVEKLEAEYSKLYERLNNVEDPHRERN